MNVQHILHYGSRIFNINSTPGGWIEKSWYRLGRLLVELYANLIFGVDVQYKMPLAVGPKILTANHPSTVDPALMTILVPEQVSILIRETLFKVPVFGASLKLAGHIRVVLSNGKPALEEGVRYLKAGRTVGMFPEGEISPRGGGFHRPHTGVARLALLTGAPVIPVGIHLDVWRIHCIHTNVEGKKEIGWWYMHGPYAITVGEPMVFSGDAEDRELVRAVSEQIMQRIAVLSQESAERLRANPMNAIVFAFQSFKSFLLYRARIFLNKPLNSLD